jgi:beta-1,2-mannobiose phosphorylase / 1,2-beta-oligomannan phosphorylase
MITITRSTHNPILQPNVRESWEAEAVLNGCPIEHDGKIKLLYRAISLPHYHAIAQQRTQISDVGIADSDDGIHFTNRRKFIVPDMHWDKFGCEDPRVTRMGDKFYTFYTALSDYPFTPAGIKVGVAISSDLSTIDQKHLVTPFNAKAMALFPRKVNGKYTAILTANSDLPPAKIAIAQTKSIDDLWSDSFWKRWYKDIDNCALTLVRFPEDHVEVGAPPVEVEDGWLMIYSYISNYHTKNRVFAIEALLLERNDPRKVIARTAGPLLTPEESYELYGFVPNVIFPSGARIEDDTLNIYYGAADHTVCLAHVSVSKLIESMKRDPTHRVRFTRFEKNPIITPDINHSWESQATFNPTAFYEDGRVHIIYRAMSADNTSVMGYATSRDGVTIEKRYERPIYIPRELFEMKIKPNGFSGCEDARITRLGDKLYMCYTAYDSINPPRVAFTSISITNFLDQKWDNWKKPVLISPPNFDNKDACLFPEKVNDNYMFLHRMGEDIDIAFVDSLELSGDQWLEEHRWLKPRKGTWDSAKVGIAGPPFKTPEGWFLFYHGVASRDMHYRIGAVLLDLDNPTKIIARTDHPLLEPKEPYEQTGMVSNVVFPCGNVLIDDTIYMYYGGGDSVIGGATLSLTKLLTAFF